MRKLLLHELLPLALLASCAEDEMSSSSSTSGSEDIVTKPKNVLILFSDQHNASVMGCAGDGYVQTPTMDALAESGVHFTNAYCQAGVSIPSRVSLMTGLYPRETGVLSNSDSPDNQERWVMMSTLFQNNGFTTGAFGKRHLTKGAMSGGWDYSATTINPNQDPNSDESYWDWLKERDLYETYEATEDEATSSPFNLAMSPLANEERDAAYTADRTIEYLRECAKGDKPFFVWASFVGPHHPYAPTADWAAKYTLGSIPLPSSVDQDPDDLPFSLDLWRSRTTPAPWNFGVAADDKSYYHTFLRNYYAQVSEVDHYMGEIIAALKEEGLYEDTIIIYSSDHGDFAGHNGMVEKCTTGHNVYGATLRVPLIVSMPGYVRSGVKSDEVVGLIDIYPTLVDMMGLNRDLTMQSFSGVSLDSHLVSGEPLNRQYIFSENWSQLTIVGKDHKLGVWIDPDYDYSGYRDWRDIYSDLLFDHNLDPEEVSNKIDDEAYNEIEQELRAEMDSWLSRTSSEGRDEVANSIN